MYEKTRRAPGTKEEIIDFLNSKNFEERFAREIRTNILKRIQGLHADAYGQNV